MSLNNIYLAGKKILWSHAFINQSSNQSWGSVISYYMGFITVKLCTAGGEKPVATPPAAAFEPTQ